MSCSHPAGTCGGCGDRLIHQGKRGKHESSSAFGQWVHDHLSDKIFYADVDGVSYKVRTKILRIYEQKDRDGELSRGQIAILPLLALGLKVLAVVGLINKQSGVFVIYTDPPYESAYVEKITHPLLPRHNRLAREMTGDELKVFIESAAA